ncbi:hypothetical protein [Devosia nitrariae]|uniref:Uncharacterized protein n=1 Tax=Devosia nitrariae TaxID=2071872 RepID=A0ABQ5WBS9_9HYPH|nr:hypothetical protein [Devosia nitrariae]GLQ57590.1 hypothetical protein GCM10010862_48490 [Devosia nitrariae]
MTWEFRSRRLHAATACTLLLAVTPVAAQEKVKEPAPAPAATTSPPEFRLEIPEITAEGSTLDADAIRDILTGNVADYAEELATLDADRILIPQATLSISGTDSTGENIVFDVDYNDIELTDVADGIAGSVSIGGTLVAGPEDASTELGAITAADFDIGATLAFYGLTDAADTGFKTIYRDLSFEGGTFSADRMDCTIGAAAIEEFRARPLGTSFVDFMALATELEAAGEEPSPELMSRFLVIYADMLTAFESTPSTFDGIDCSGVTEDDVPMTFAMGKLTIGGFEPGRYPQVSIENLEVMVEGGPEAGDFSVGSTVFKGFDFSAQAEVLRNAPENVDETWFESNARSLIPAFEGFALSDIAFDVPNPDAPGERITASVGAFDLSLANYVNGIPASIDSSASNVVINLPETSEDEQIQQMIAAGITSLDLGYNLSLAWDEATETIAVKDVTFDARDIMTLKLAGTLGNAVAELFSTDTNVAAMAGMGVTVKDVKLDITDAGFVKIALDMAGAEQGADAATMRPMMAGVAEGMVMGVLGGDEQAAKVGAAVAAFIRGNDTLSLTVTALDEAGLTMFDFMAAESDPTALISKVKIDATSE